MQAHAKLVLGFRIRNFRIQSRSIVQSCESTTAIFNQMQLNINVSTNVFTCSGLSRIEWFLLICLFWDLVVGGTWRFLYSLLWLPTNFLSSQVRQVWTAVALACWESSTSPVFLQKKLWLGNRFGGFWWWLWPLKKDHHHPPKKLVFQGFQIKFWKQLG